MLSRIQKLTAQCNVLRCAMVELGRQLDRLDGQGAAADAAHYETVDSKYGELFEQLRGHQEAILEAKPRHEGDLVAQLLVIHDWRSDGLDVTGAVAAVANRAAKWRPGPRIEWP